MGLKGESADAQDTTTNLRAHRTWSTFESGGRLLILDGATGSELTAKPGIDWSAQWSGWPAQLHLPEALRSVHQSYVAAGADILTTNTYSANRHVMGNLCRTYKGLDMVREANLAAVSIAKEAASTSGRPILVAGSMSNHAPSYVSTATSSPGLNPTLSGNWPPAEVERSNYREQASLLREAGVDLLLLEMVKDWVHGDLLVSAATEMGLPVIVGLTLRVSDDGAVTARDDGSFHVAEMVERWGACPEVVGFAVMHCSAADAAAMVSAVAASWGGFIGCYPNRQLQSRGLVVPDDACAYDAISPEQFASLARNWIASGARMIGGCCGIGPGHIQAVAHLAEQHGRNLPDSKSYVLPNDVENNHPSDSNKLNNVAIEFPKLVVKL
eukprot:CAMPEP_0177624562 /NCGR_PEP_ID=MMETSP0419_2-20121207/29558_1 /TAXON_ID=582737 /ORGANISM="Tetraselmis sp., Strain GSL018" /LENGTH=383 /DNA_ID=CAMNT_0019125301 /DNA_START=442 /DNA_END=1594 /DNA_ORIENTATION=+